MEEEKSSPSAQAALSGPFGDGQVRAFVDEFALVPGGPAVRRPPEWEAFVRDFFSSRPGLPRLREALLSAPVNLLLLQKGDVYEVLLPSKAQADWAAANAGAAIGEALRAFLGRDGAFVRFSVSPDPERKG